MTNDKIKTSTSDERRFLRKLEGRAELVSAAKASAIAADGPLLAEWEVNGIHVIKRPDDSQGILRISVGGCDAPIRYHYCTFRGDKEQCIALLEAALAAMRQQPAG